MAAPAQACAWSSVININAFTGAEDMKTETRIGDWRITLNREDGHGLVSEVWRRRREGQSPEALKGADSDRRDGPGRARASSGRQRQETLMGRHMKVLRCDIANGPGFRTSVWMSRMHSALPRLLQ